MSKNGNSKYGKLIKILQIASFAFMIAMLVVCLVFLKKNNISVKNVDALIQYLPGEMLTAALIIIGFSVVKSFALVFPPAVLFVLSGIFFKDMATAVLVNCIATACSLILPYFLGRFTGSEMFETLKGKFKAIQKLDSFTDTNSFAVVFIFKAGGLLPSDLSSLIFGALKIPFGKYFVASNLGLLVLNVLWTLVGVKGDLTNPFSYLYALPALLLAIAASVFMSIREKKRHDSAKNNIQTEVE